MLSSDSLIRPTGVDAQEKQLKRLLANHIAKLSYPNHALTTLSHLPAWPGPQWSNCCIGHCIVSLSLLSCIGTMLVSLISLG